MTRATSRSDRVVCRGKGDFVDLEPARVDYMDVSPKQLVSVAASLIPFLEHDDANRALMGSNMQRQAVPLLVTEAPFVATGLEDRVARDSRAVIVAEEAGKVASVTGNQIIITEDGKLPEGKKKIKHDPEKGIYVYPVRKFMRSNAATCINQKILVQKGEHVKKGQIIADGPCTRERRTRARPQRARRLHAVERLQLRGRHPHQRDASSRTTSSPRIHIDEFEVAARDTKLGPEEITRDIPNLGDEALKNLGPDGVIRVGAEVKPGDILVGKITPKSETELAPEERLLRAIFGEKAADVKDTSLKVPSGTYGIVMDVKVSSKKESERERVDRHRGEEAGQAGRGGIQEEDGRTARPVDGSAEQHPARRKDSARRGEQRNRRNHHPGQPQDHQDAAAQAGDGLRPHRDRSLADPQQDQRNHRQLQKEVRRSADAVRRGDGARRSRRRRGQRRHQVGQGLHRLEAQAVGR